jgi:N-acyl-D-aspartate/D-glutamate deacylase
MANNFDLVVRGGFLIDGLGGDGFEADVAVCDGKIAEIGRVAGKGREEISAKGLLVTPGFVDLHTHYDGQATWEHNLAPSSLHGVTTAIMGNCGVGFAPCRPEDHGRLIHLMEGVEDIPEVVMAEGIPWAWETYPQYLDWLSHRNYDIDLGSYLPHAPLRVYVMGDRACNHEPATDEDLAHMSAIAEGAMRAGAFGFGTSRTMFHRSTDGFLIPTIKAEEKELMMLAMAMSKVGKGIMQIVMDWHEPEKVPEQFASLRRVVEKSGRPMTFTLTQRQGYPDTWRKVLDLTEDAVKAGLQISAQFCPRPIGVLLGHELTLNPFYTMPTYKKLMHLPIAQRIQELRKPEVRTRILQENRGTDVGSAISGRVGDYAYIFPFNDPPDYEPAPESNLADEAARRGVKPDELAYDMLLENDGRSLLYLALHNYEAKDLEVSSILLKHEAGVLGLGDGGAHLRTICDASYSTFMLTHWVRDRSRGSRIPLVKAVQALTSRPAFIGGLADRGRIATGYRADLNVIDFDRLSTGFPKLKSDLPAGGQRLIQKPSGYVANVVNGVVTYRNGTSTGALPGKLVRGPQASPAHA